MERGGGEGRENNLTKYTAAFIVATRNSIKIDEIHCFCIHSHSIAAANHLFQHHQYILPAVFSTNPLEKFFGTARERVRQFLYWCPGHNFSHQKPKNAFISSFKHNILSDANEEGERDWSICDADIEEDDLNLVDGAFILEPGKLFSNPTIFLNIKSLPIPRQKLWGSCDDRILFYSRRVSYLILSYPMANDQKSCSINIKYFRVCLFLPKIPPVTFLFRPPPYCIFHYFLHLYFHFPLFDQFWRNFPAISSYHPAIPRLLISG